MSDLQSLGMYAQPQEQRTLLQKLGETWPAKMAQSIWGGLTLPGDVYAGRVEPGGLEAIGRAAELTGVLGSGAPMTARAGAAGIFGGRLAKTADQAALSKAEQMATEGVDKGAIWNQTGWFQGADGKWRFEIDDSRAAFTPRTVEEFGAASVGNQAASLKSPAIMAHSDLYTAYPEMRSVNTELVKGGGYPYQPSAYFQKNQGRPSSISIDAHNLDAARSLNLHELQHAVQQSPEGFAIGGNPKDFTRGYNSIVRDAEEQIATINERMKQASGTPRYYELMDMRSELVNEIQKIKGPHGVGAREKGFDEYKRLAGEVEARNVEARANMTPQERRATAPWLTQDVPFDQQIVRFK